MSAQSRQEVLAGIQGVICWWAVQTRGLVASGCHAVRLAPAVRPHHRHSSSSISPRRAALPPFSFRLSAERRRVVPCGVLHASGRAPPVLVSDLSVVTTGARRARACCGGPSSSSSRRRHRFIDTSKDIHVYFQDRSGPASAAFLGVLEYERGIN